MKLLLGTILSFSFFDASGRERRITGGHEQNPKDGPTTAWNADLKLTLERRGKEWIFVLQGTATVPREVRLRARIYAVETIRDPMNGPREDEEPLVYEEDEIQPSFTILGPLPGRFRSEVCRFARRPWSIRYRGRIQYRPRDQKDQVLATFGEKEWGLYTDFRVGSQAEYARELADQLQETTRDLMALESSFRELRKKLDEGIRNLDPAVWNGWKDSWRAKVDDMDARNKLRYGLWAVWLERQAKMRIGGLCELLRRALRAAEEEFGHPKPDVARIAEILQHWRDYFEDGIDRMDVDLPLDQERIDPLIRDYEIAFAPLRQWLEDRGSEDVRRQTRRECMTALLKITALLDHRKRVYPAVNEICAALVRLLEASDAPASPEGPAAIKDALTEHDKALKDLQKIRTFP